jgi:prolipoprotein diacylglyceryltransferase
MAINRIGALVATAEDAGNGMLWAIVVGIVTAAVWTLLWVWRKIRYRNDPEGEAAHADRWDSERLVGWVFGLRFVGGIIAVIVWGVSANSNP